MEWRTKLGEARDLTERTILEMRRLIAALSPAVLEQLGLGAALRQLVNRFQRLHPCRVRLQLSKMGVLPQQIEIIAYRLVQECFNNIGKHCRRHSCKHFPRFRRWTSETDRWKITGSASMWKQALAKRESFGMSGMRERVALLGGEFRVESRTEGAKRGTKISIELPIAK